MTTDRFLVLVHGGLLKAHLETPFRINLAIIETTRVFLVGVLDDWMTFLVRNNLVLILASEKME